MLQLFSLGLTLLLVSGCASYGLIDNAPKVGGVDAPGDYSLRTGGGGGGDGRGSGEISLVLAFSGGGTRAAALAYGVLQELRDTTATIDGRPRRILDEVDAISSVSGGSFTSAYYGLYGDRIFDDFEDDFLKRDIQGRLIRGLLNPLEWFSQTGRTEMAVKFYQDTVFHGATFADLKRKGGPLIVINASDLGYGVRFSFVQEYFNLLCSDISSFPVARAVTASSAVPVLFNPVVLENYSDCKNTKPVWLAAAEKRAAGNPQLIQVVDGLRSYYNKRERRYVHFVDGGITDNTGLRAVYEIIEVGGGMKAFLKRHRRKPPRYFVILAVNASTDPEPKMDGSNEQPSLEEVINAVSDVQLHRYNAATLELIEQSMKRWARELSTPERPITPYFIQVGFRDIQEPERARFFNHIPTSFSLTDEQVNKLTAAGRALLRENPDFQRFIADLGGARPVVGK